ncbi:hypothetical protein SH661x_001287 [Planctomicrobium sp. SH661]|uniref:hypothetical protein n=1 Tax=Planctomicrobium sp. SH661 TaxID=3448124 RepID=UPI003F5B9BD9
MKRLIPLLITAIGGFVLIVAFFIPAFQQAGEEAAIWFDVLAAIAFILGGANLFRLHLQEISDRKAGWGYSAVTLFCFVLTLALGLLKVDCPPEPSVEAYGESFAQISPAVLPTFNLPLTSPLSRGDGAPLPKSVRQQLSVTNENGREVLKFVGWMQQEQFDDLSAFQDTLEWRCQAERLFELAQPPAELAGKIRYLPGHDVLAFRGMMNDQQRASLLNVLHSSEVTTKAVDQLYDLSRRKTFIQVSKVPAGFSIPESQLAVVQLSDNTLTVHGPMSIRLRDQIADQWTHAPRVRPYTSAQVTDLIDSLNRLGKLNDHQRTALENLFAADWKPELLVQVLNTAGITAPEPKSSCELLAEIQVGESNPQLTKAAPPPVVLNPEQTALVQKFVETPEMTQAQLTEQLIAAGEFTATQQEALNDFFDSLPTRADQMKDLCFRMLAVGPLSPEIVNFLLQDAREQFQWRQKVGELFISAHQTKFPWSGDYSAQGSPFWWLYEYAMQPLLTTTFAVLAFYVASAAFRAFRAKNLEAILLLGTAFIILLGRTSAGPALTSWIPNEFSAFRLDQMTVYIMSIFNTAGNRAIMIGIALGTVSTSLKVLLGIDRSYLGKGDE